MNKLIDTAIKLGKFDMLLNEYDLKEILSDDDISSTLAWMVFLWEELEKEKKKYIRKSNMFIPSAGISFSNPVESQIDFVKFDKDGFTLDTG